MKYKELIGDLFKSSGPIGHCVSEDLDMGKGIAVEFKRRFGMVSVLLNQKKGVGEVAYIEDEKRGYIFYLITKKYYWQKPKLESLIKALHNLKDICLTKDVKLLSLPLIGCGLDRLDWGEVSEAIKSIFEDTDIEINIYKLK